MGVVWVSYGYEDPSGYSWRLFRVMRDLPGALYQVVWTISGLLLYIYLLPISSHILVIALRYHLYKEGETGQGIGVHYSVLRR